MKNLLAGDIGGTKTLLQVDTKSGIFSKSYPSAGYPGLAEMLGEFFREAGVADVDAACFALAGPVAGRKVRLTNLPWEVDADAIAARFDIARVTLVNDFEAVGYGIAALQSGDLLTLQAGVPAQHGTRLVAGAGTGLGVAWLSWTGNAYTVHPSEGGHIDFAPADALQYGLLCHLQRRYGHVSYERIVSGPGLQAIYEYLRDSGSAAPSPHLVEAMAAGDASAAITRFALQEDEPIARLALDLFVSAYGAFVGNLALLALPRGGIYIAGGIAAKISQAMQRGEFMRAFLDKGRYAAMLETLPLHIVTNPATGLLGARSLAG
jgi:glucokinase